MGNGPDKVHHMTWRNCIWNIHNKQQEGPLRVSSCRGWFETLLWHSSKFYCTTKCNHLTQSQKKPKIHLDKTCALILSSFGGNSEAIPSTASLHDHTTYWSPFCGYFKSLRGGGPKDFAFSGMLILPLFITKCKWVLTRYIKEGKKRLQTTWCTTRVKNLVAWFRQIKEGEMQKSNGSFAYKLKDGQIRYVEKYRSFWTLTFQKKTYAVWMSF